MYNVHTTGVRTIQARGKIAAAEGKNQVGLLTSSNRRTLARVCFAVNATQKDFYSTDICIRRRNIFMGICFEVDL
jgi:hypothetical protein